MHKTNDQLKKFLSVKKNVNIRVYSIKKLLSMKMCFVISLRNDSVVIFIMCSINWKKRSDATSNLQNLINSAKKDLGQVSQISPPNFWSCKSLNISFKMM